MATGKSKKRRQVEDDEDEAPRRKKGGNLTAKIDLRDATPGGGRVRVPEGDYHVKVTGLKKEVNKNSGNTQVKVSFTIVAPEKYEGKVITDFLTLTRKAAFRSGMVFDAVGIKWSQKITEFNFGKLMGKELGVTVYDDEWKKRISSKVADYMDLETVQGILEGTDDEDEDLDEDEDEDSDDGDDEDEDEDDDDDEDEDL